VSTGKRRLALVHLTCALCCAIGLAPVLLALSASFKPASSIYSLGVISAHSTLGNYREAFSGFPLVPLLVRSAVIALAVAVGQVALALLAAYAIAVLRPKGSGLLYAALTVTLLVPQQSVVVPQYLLASHLGLFDNYAGIALPQIAVVGFGVRLLRAHLESLPPNVIASAELEGASSGEVLLRIVVPMVRPALVALAVLVFITSWNEYLWPLLIAPSPGRTTLQIGLQQFLTEQGIANGPLLAAAVVAIVPILLVYLVNQRRIAQAFVHSGIR
jgi:ABC-type glycerol-3-phosphate transport system permease component